jgi:chlorophyll/bacteriochlorophyll a synthase
MGKSQQDLLWYTKRLKIRSFSAYSLVSFQAGHDFPIIFYLALGGSLLSYIYSAPPLKVLEYLCSMHSACCF